MGDWASGLSVGETEPRSACRVAVQRPLSPGPCPGPGPWVRVRLSRPSRGGKGGFPRRTHKPRAQRWVLAASCAHGWASSPPRLLASCPRPHDPQVVSLPPSRPPPQPELGLCPQPPPLPPQAAPEQGRGEAAVRRPKSRKAGLAPPPRPPKGRPHICLGHQQSRGQPEMGCRGRIGRFVQNVNEAFPGRRRAFAGLRRAGAVRRCRLHTQLWHTEGSVVCRRTPSAGGRQRTGGWVRLSASTRARPAPQHPLPPSTPVRTTPARVLALL